MSTPARTATTVRIEHAVSDYPAWKQIFDSDPLDRRGSGVQRYRVHRSMDTPNHVFIDLDFAEIDAAREMVTKLADLWSGSAARLIVNPRAVILECVESGEA